MPYAPTGYRTPPTARTKARHIGCIAVPLSCRHGPTVTRRVRMLKIGCTMRDPVAIGRLTAAFATAELVPVSPDQLLTVAIRRGLLAVVIGADDVTRLGGGTLARIKRLAPTVLLIAYLSNDRRLPQMAFELGRIGVDVLCIRDVDDHPVRMREMVGRALSRLFITDVAVRVERTAPELPAYVVESALLRIAEVKNARDLASSLEMSLPRLRSILRRASLPAPRRFLLWCKLLLAGRLLEDGARTVDAVARLLDYCSAPAFRNACRRLVRLTPTAIRRGGGLAFVAQLFEKEVRGRQSRSLAARG